MNITLQITEKDLQRGLWVGEEVLQLANLLAATAPPEPEAPEAPQEKTPCPAPAEEPATPEPPAPEHAIGIEEVRAAIAKVSKKHGTERAKEILRKFGAGNLSALDTGLYAAALAEAEGAFIMPGAHARLSASGAKKWLACPGSLLLEEGIAERPSAYAEEGTAAHALGEVKLRHALKEYTRAKYHKAIRDLEIDDEMEDCTDAYRDYVLERFQDARRGDPCALLLLEQRLDYSAYAPEGFGTGDCVIIGGGRVEIIDLKYGKGVAVRAAGNPQLRLYALGALAAYDFLYDITEIRVAIFQPRIDNIDSETLPAAELRAWGESIRPIAEQAYSGTGETRAGRHCDEGFCRARPVCRAYAELRQELAKYEFQRPALLAPEEISEVLEQAEALAKWATLVKEYALSEALQNGTAFPGWKVVEGRSNRAFSIDDTLVAGQLIARGYNEDDIWPRKLKGITALEKYLGKKEFDALLGEFVHKPAGKPTLVPETDKRPAIGSAGAALADFQTITD